MLMLHRLYSIQISGMRDTRTARSLFSTYNYTNQRQRAFVQQTVCIHIKTVIVLNQVLDEAVPFDTVYLISLQEAVEAVLIVMPRDRHALYQASHCEIRRCNAAGECG
jgi:hypothetical protein